MELAVRNETDDNFTAVEVEVSIPGLVAAFFDPIENVELPKPPRRWGTSRVMTMPTSTLGLDYASLVPRMPAMGFNRGHIDNSKSAVITFPEVDLRPEEVWPLDPVLLVISQDHADETILATWRITTTNASGTSRGTLELQVLAEVVEPTELIRRSAGAKRKSSGDNDPA